MLRIESAVKAPQIKREETMPYATGWRAVLALALWAILQPVTATAQNYPTRPITIVVPLAAGTGMDSLVRLYADKLQSTLGQPVVVENRPGAALMLAAAAVATAPADGYTLLVSTSAPMAINPTLYKKLSYNHEKDFVPISLYVKSPFILVVDPKLPINSVPDLIKYAKESKTPLTYSSPGAGTALHLSSEYMKQRYGLDITHVPYKSSPQAVADIAAGHVAMAFAEAGASLPLIKDGKLRAIAVSSQARLPSLPDVPTFAEAANAPDFEAVSWHVLLAPSATPKPVVDRLHAEMKKIMSDAAMKKLASNIGLIPVDTPSVDGIEQYFKSEREKWGALVRQLGLQGSM
jgi:tripartite-type tricarboxylate transporter receptor subunit TctC